MAEEDMSRLPMSLQTHKLRIRLQAHQQKAEPRLARKH